MVELIPYNQIDFDKYDACVAQSVHPLLYAESWYLDIETNKDWQILMHNDYQSVMPLPFFRLKQSFWKKTLINAYHTQQLGIVSSTPLNQKMHGAFQNKFYELNPKVYSFNVGQNMFLNTSKLIQKNNYVLNLNPTYEDLFSNFSKTRRRWVRKALKCNLKLTKISDIKLFIEFQKRHLKLIESPSVIKKRKAIIITSMQKNLGKLYGIYQSDELIGTVFFIYYRNRLYYLQSATSEKGKNLHAMDFALNHIIEKFAGKNLILDFEGSQLEGVANYMKSFGAVNEPYYTYKS